MPSTRSSAPSTRRSGASRSTTRGPSCSASAPRPASIASRPTRTITPRARRCRTCSSGSGTGRRRSTRRSGGAWPTPRSSRPTTCWARFAEIETAAGGTTLILTGDRDMFQCASDSVTVLLQRTGGDGPEEVGPDVVREKYGVDPEQVPDFIALRGDPSDGLPGAKGIGAEDRRRPAAAQGRPRARDPRRDPREAVGAPRADRAGRRAARVQGHRDAARRSRSSARRTRRPTSPADRRRPPKLGMGRLSTRLEEMAQS